jgi:hypothetical protein
MNEAYQGVQHIFGSFDGLETIVRKFSEPGIYDTDLVSRYCLAYKDWILSTKLNSIQGLEKFDHIAYSNGTTESFDKFRLRHKEKTLKVLKDEYLYHQLYLGATAINDISELKKGDAFVMSAPFAKTGEIYPLSETILDTCDSLEIPVLIDSAFFGFCGNLSFNYDHPCIEDVAFSLSKIFSSVSLFRIGIRFSKISNDSLADFSKEGYVNRFGAGVGIELLKQYGPDHLFETYRKTQLDFCERLDLYPSNTVVFGIDVKNQYGMNPRFDEKSRFCFSKYLASGKLPE